MSLTLISILVSLLVIILTFFKWRYNYWKRRGVPQLSPIIPFGDVKELLLQKTSISEQYVDIYRKMRAQGLKYVGAYFAFKPVLIVADPELTKTMLISDFSHFVNHGVFPDNEKDPLSRNIFNLRDGEWKSLRQKLTPTFTSGKIKMMVEIINNCALNLKTIIKESSEQHTPIDVKELMGQYTTDVIGSVAFGIECNSLKDPDCEFRYYGRKIFEMSIWDNFKTALIVMLPQFILRQTALSITKKDVENFFTKALHDIVKIRETQNIQRKDFLQLLIQLKNKGSLDDETLSKDDLLTMAELVAQAYFFFLAAFETTSTTLNFLMFELAVNQDIQDKLRKEIRTILQKHENKYTYEALNEMVYLDKIITETLRKYPPVPILNRVCNKDFIIPNTNICIKKNTSVEFVIDGMQNDPEYYESPEKFNPERFANEDKNSRPWMPFGDGPRSCLGKRLAMIQMKLAIINVINDFKVKLNQKTSTPLKYLPGVFIKTVEGSVWLDAELI